MALELAWKASGLPAQHLIRTQEETPSQPTAPLKADRVLEPGRSELTQRLPMSRLKAWNYASAQRLNKN